MIVCDHCDSRTRQPLPHGWRVLWLSAARAWGHACPSCGERLDAGEHLVRATITDARGTRVAPVTFTLNPPAVDDALRATADSIAVALEAAVRDEDLSTPATDSADSIPGIIRSPRLIEPAPGVEIYDRPRLPRSLRDAAPRDGATVEAFVRKVGETFVPPAATRPRAAAPDVKQPSEPPAPLQRSLFGGES